MNRKAFLATAIALITAPFIKAKEPKKTSLTINYKVDTKELQQRIEKAKREIMMANREEVWKHTVKGYDLMLQKERYRRTRLY